VSILLCRSICCQRQNHLFTCSSHWYSYRSRTGGGGAHTIGNAEARRHGAKEFLVKVKDTVGAAKYLKLVDHLKGLHGRVITVPQCREAFQSELHDHPELMSCFDEFLPKKFGGTGS